MATAEQVIAQVQTYMATLTGIRQALPDLPNQVSTELTSICYLISGTSGFVTPEGRIALDELIVEVITPIGTDLSRAHQRIIPFVDSVPNLLMKKMQLDKWNSTVTSIGGSNTQQMIGHQYFTMKFGDVDYMGYRFTVHAVKRLIDVT
jgi:hypothetical protein